MCLPAAEAPPAAPPDALPDAVRARREELRALRERLCALHAASIAAVEEHALRDRELLALVASRRPRRGGAAAPDRLFADFSQLQRQNAEERPRSLRMEGEVLLHIQNAQKEASDRRFEHDNALHQAVLLRRAAVDWARTLAELDARFAQAQLEFIQLNRDEKTLIGDNQRLKHELRGWAAHLGRLGKAWTDVKERFDLLAGERERREGVLLHRLDAARARRDAQAAAVAGIREEQASRRERIARLEVDVEDWVERRERADAELRRLVGQASHRQAQLRLFAAITDPEGGTA
jgi:chromosome segregation ATPase